MEYVKRMRSLFALLIVTLSISFLAINTTAVFGQMTTTTEERTTALSFLNNIQTQKVRVGDIDIAYKIFGKGEPLLLIPGFAMTMDIWDPVTLYKLSSNHTIIIFDNRGLGKTTAGTKNWSIEQFANDTAGLIDALGIKKPVDILGASWGGYVAQELTLMHPQKVNKLILYGTDCGGNATILSPQISPELDRSIEYGNATVDTFLSVLFPEQWIQENADYVRGFFSSDACF
jgi:pimeloyl-ACP methyl ester carboxylesterase